MSERYFLQREQLAELFHSLREQGYRLLGPRVHDGSIQLRPIDSPEQLPRGILDQQQPGSYRLQSTESERYFAWANGAQALKPLSFASEEPLWQMQRTGDGLAFSSLTPPTEPLAVIGVRACDLAAQQLQDMHFMRGEEDPHFATRRRGQFLVAVDCSHPAETCFCASTGDGPEAQAGYDLALSELENGFILRHGSDAGRALLEGQALPLATPSQLAEGAAQIAAAIESQQRRLPSTQLATLLASRRDPDLWQEVAQRCLACGNCTAVCPTCFCHREEDEPALDGQSSLHVRRWDSCFTPGHSTLHGIPVRSGTPERYRQWLTHKLGTWHEQYGRSGCVGCGRCITWCPVGIDITAEMNKLLEAD